MTYHLELVAKLATDGTQGSAPSGVTVAGIRFIAFDSNGANVGQQDVASGLTADFTGLVDNKGTATAQYVGSDGSLLGDAQTTSYDYENPTPPADVTFTPLASLSATIAQE